MKPHTSYARTGVMGLVLMIGALNGSAQTTGTTSDGLMYSDSAGSVTITGYSGIGGAVTVPATIGGDPVTSIGNEAFLAARLTSITLPNGLISIGSLAFLEDGGLTTIAIPSTVTTIGLGAFESCQGLASIVIPASVTTLGPGAFNGCGSLTGLSIDAANPSYSTDGFALFDKNKTTLYECLTSTAGNYAIPGSVTTIGDPGFADCGSLTGVSFPASVSSISSPVTNPFEFCFDLTRITVDAANPYFSSDGIAFFNKAKTALIAYSPGIVGTYAVPAGVASIGDSAFASCQGLVGITMPAGLTSIGDDAFNACSNLATVAMPDSVTSIGGYAFSGCSHLVSVAIPAGLTEISQSVFRSCALTSVTIPSGVSTIDASAFQDCTSLAQIAFLGNAPSADPTAFQDVKAAATITYVAGTTGWTNPFDGLPASQAAAPAPPAPPAPPSPPATPPPPTARLVNISTRAQVGTGGGILIPGFVITGNGVETLLIRAAGPSLTQFGVPGVLATPSLQLFDATQRYLMGNDGWSGVNSDGPQIAAAAAQVGAFAFTTGSADCAILTTLAPGSYTVEISGVGTSTGVALAEVYEVSFTGTARLSNISTRAMVGTGGNIVIPGFAIRGSGTEQLLIRGDGPSLGQFNVPGVLAQPMLGIYDSSQALISSNTAWGTASNPAQIASVSASVGAFSFQNGSADSALVVSLPSGNYTVQLSGVNNSTGVALAELYEVP